MELTAYYIGDSWYNETMPLMAVTIKHCGIYNAIWLSRVAMYAYFFFTYRYRHNNDVVTALVVLTLLYYASMINWLIFFHLISMP
jgi:hypothetical protein